MGKEQIFPLLSVILSLGASVTYFVSLNIGKGLYWLLGAMITVIVTWLI